jgi:hypothetical protein
MEWILLAQNRGSCEDESALQNGKGFFSTCWFLKTTSSPHSKLVT